MAFAPDLEERKLGEGSQSPWVCSALRGPAFWWLCSSLNQTGSLFPRLALEAWMATGPR